MENKKVANVVLASKVSDLHALGLENVFGSGRPSSDAPILHVYDTKHINDHSEIDKLLLAGHHVLAINYDTPTAEHYRQLLPVSSATHANYNYMRVIRHRKTLKQLQQRNVFSHDRELFYDWLPPEFAVGVGLPPDAINTEPTTTVPSSTTSTSAPVYNSPQSEPTQAQLVTQFENLLNRINSTDYLWEQGEDETLNRVSYLSEWILEHAIIEDLSTLGNYQAYKGMEKYVKEHQLNYGQDPRWQTNVYKTPLYSGSSPVNVDVSSPLHNITSTIVSAIPGQTSPNKFYATATIETNSKVTVSLANKSSPIPEPYNSFHQITISSSVSKLKEGKVQLNTANLDSTPQYLSDGEFITAKLQQDRQDIGINLTETWTVSGCKMQFALINKPDSGASTVSNLPISLRYSLPKTQQQEGSASEQTSEQLTNTLTFELNTDAAGFIPLPTVSVIKDTSFTQSVSLDYSATFADAYVPVGNFSGNYSFFNVNYRLVGPADQNTISGQIFEACTAWSGNLNFDKHDSAQNDGATQSSSALLSGDDYIINDMTYRLRVDYSLPTVKPDYSLATLEQNAEFLFSVPTAFAINSQNYFSIPPLSKIVEGCYGANGQTIQFVNESGIPQFGFASTFKIYFISSNSHLLKEGQTVDLGFIFLVEGVNSLGQTVKTSTPNLALYDYPEERVDYTIPQNFQNYFPHQTTLEVVKAETETSRSATSNLLYTTTITSADIENGEKNFLLISSSQQVSYSVAALVTHPSLTNADITTQTYAFDTFFIPAIGS